MRNSRLVRVLLLGMSALTISITHADLITQGSYSAPSSAADTWEDDAPTIIDNASIHAKYGSSAQNSTSFNSPAERIDGWLTQRPLAEARTTSGWGTRTLLGSTRHHSGLDLAAPTGTPIYASGNGWVTKAGWGTGYGNYVEIDHGNGYITRYGHASRLHVSAGDHVTAGQLIANVGCTGRCTGPHLHFEIVKSGQRQNPSPYLALLP